MTEPKKQLRYFDDLDTSTCFCPCGASITWSGFDKRFDRWLKEHKPHATDGTAERVITEDGMRCMAKP